MSIQGVILAAGKGKRLQPVTPARTKAMAPVAGKPIVARVFDLLVQNGIQEIILLVSPDDDAIVPYFEAHTPPGVNVIFVVQHERLGMAHALGLVAPHLRGDFVMSACDNLVPPAHLAALIAHHRQAQATATLSLMEIDIAYAASTGIVEWADATQRLIRRIVEKPQPAEAPSNVSSLPLYVFSAKLLDYLPAVQPSPRGEYELQDAIQLLIEHTGRVTGVLTDVRWQLTNVQDLLELNRHYLALEAAPLHGMHAGVQLIPPVRIDADCVLETACVIGPHVYLEAGCRIGSGARIENAILLRNAVVAAGTVVAGAVVMQGA
ncbi:MAG: NTP transferase domain-containing protein [Caldilineaceae bacterium]|nr:NTP transferase domain-containing protein [Caldilineaceae bacterium]